MHFLVGLTRRVCLGLAPCLFALSVRAQDNYEIQVYGSETVPTGRTTVELHSNYTIEGERQIVNGVLPSVSLAGEPHFNSRFHPTAIPAPRVEAVELHP